MSRVDNIINGVRQNGTEKKKSRVETIIEGYANGNINTGVDQKYIDTFVNDLNDFFTTAEKDLGEAGLANASSVADSKRDTWSDLRKRANTINAWLNINRNNIDQETFDSLSTVLNDVRSGISPLDDFARNSQRGKEVSNPSWKDSFAPLDVFGWTPFGDGATINNMVTFAEANKENIIASEIANQGGSSDHVKLAYRINLYMTDNEKAMYNYYIGKGDYGKANQYLESLKDVFTQREAGQIVENVKGSKLQEMFFAVAAGLDQFGYGIRNLDNLFTGAEADPFSAVQYAAPSVREDVGDGGWGVAYDLINTTSNMLPSILVGSFTGGLGGALTLGTSAVGNGYAEMRNLGYNEWQARGYGLLVGASETALQYALGGISPLGKAGGGVASKLVTKALGQVDNGLARFAINLGANMFDEAFEEAAQSVLEPIFKSILTGDNYDVDWGEVAYSALLGALSAGTLESIPTIGTAKKARNTDVIYGDLSVKDAVKTFWENKKLGDVKSAYEAGKKTHAENASALVTEALEIDPENAHAQRMQKRLDGGKDISGYQLNRLIEANESAMYSQDTDKIKSAIETRLAELGENGDVSNLVDALTKQASGEKLSLSEKNLIKKSEYGVRVSNELNPDNVKTGEYTSEWAEKIGTERINAQAYNEGEVIGSFESAVKKVSMAEPPEDESVGKIPSAKENATEAKFKASTDGKTKIGDTEVSIKEIASVKDGEVMLRLEDGSTVNASDVEYGSSEEGLLYENVADMNLNAATANAFVKGYDPSMSADQYAKGFREAYRYGEYNFPVQEMSKDGFSALLSESQKSLSYNLGKTDAKYKVEAKQKAITEKSSAIVSKKEQVKTTKGKLHNTIKPSTERQRASLKTLGVLAEALGIDIYTFESAVVNGKRQGANGWFDPKDGSIHIDIHAGINGEGTMLFTAAHELTHFIREWSPSKFKVFADFLLEQYGKKGISVDALVNEQIAKAKRNGRDVSYDTAYEEVVADSCESMLADGDAIAKIAELKAKDKTLWEKIKDFLTKLVARIKSAYEGMTPDSAEGRYVAEMLDTAEKLKALWTEALVDASDNYTASEIVEINTESKSVSPMFSERTWTASEYVTEREKTAKAIAKALNVDINTAYKYIDDINSVARLIADDRVRLDYEPNLDEKATVLKPNSEYKYTVDMSTLCAKRLLFTGTFDAIQKALPNMVFDSEDIVSLREMMQKRGYEVACGICYVESTRREIGRITQDFIDSYKEAQKTGKPITRLNSEGKTVELKKTKEQKETTADKSTDKFYAEKGYTPTLADLNTTDIDLVKRDHPLVYEAYLNFMNARGQAKPKLLETRAEYKGEILNHFKYKSAVNSRNNAGGLRLQSFSDFEVPHLIDMMQIVMDMSRVGLKSQAYTKVPAFAEVFGDSGVKINLSLIAKGDGLDSNGNLIFDDVEGINHKEAFKLRDKYSKNVGTILVGKNDAHIIAAMADPRIDYIIPFHKSSWKESLYDALGLTGYADYTDTQNEKPLDKDRKIKNFDPSEYWDFTKSGDENAQIYLEKCREDGRIPKFPQFQGYPGYWKLLIDFKMYDNDGVGSPQEVVNPVFNTEASERILREYRGGHKSFPVAKDVVEDFVKEHKDNVKYSDRASYAPTFYSYMGKVVDGIKSAKVGSKDVVSYLKGKGVKAEEIKWSGIEAFLEGKKSVTKAELQEFVAGSQLQIEEEMSNTATYVDEDGNTYSDTEFKDKAYAIAEEQGIDRDRVKFVLDPDDGSYVAYAGSRFSGIILEAEADTSSGMIGRWSEYKIDGGTNYRELVFKLPNSSYSNRAMRGHWGQDAEGVLAHARIQDITTADGKKMLFIEEIQSDWHNEGHQKGYSTKEYEDAVESHDKLYNEYKKLDLAFHKYVRSNEFMTDPEDVRKKKHEWLRGKAETAQKKYLEAEKVVDSLKEQGAGDTPDAPFRNNYHEYVLKRLLRMAAEEGYDSIGWTPADIQADRWSYDYEKAYKIEYDQDIPSFLKKYGKKWGATVGKTALPFLKPNASFFDVNRGEEYKSFVEWQNIVERDLKAQGAPMRNVMYESDDSYWIAYDKVSGVEYDRAEIRRTSESVWSMDIPDSMKDSVLHEGQVLYSDRNNIGYHAGDLGKAEYYYQQGYGRGTGHFGTGTYFVGNEEKISGNNTYGKRPHHAVDFSDYNLYKIKDEEDGYKLHEQLRVIDGGLRQDFYEKALDDEFSFYPHVSVFDLAEKKYKTKSNTWEEAYIPAWKDIANERGIEYQSEEEWSKENNFPTDDEYFADYYSEYLEKAVKEATEAVEEKYRRFRETYFHLWLRFGSANTRRAMQKTISYQKEINPNGQRDYFAERDKKADSLATVFMKALGYDGIDVRGTRLDNVEYGSVIYDLKEDTVLWQDRDTDSVSNRSLLANALESVAQNDIEKKKLEEYKGKIALIESEQAKLSEIRAKIKELSFAKGKRDTEAIRNLQFEENQTANRINTYDKQLLNLESTTALKGVLEREKKMAYKRAEQRGKDALAAYRERATKTQRELMTRYQESRKKGVESRNKTAMRHKIKDVVSELNQYLLKGTKDKHVPIELQKAVAEALDAVNMDTVGAEERIAKKQAEMRVAKSLEEMQRLSKEIEHIQEQGGNMEAKLSRLKTAYDSIINSDDPLIANSHDDVISSTITKVIEVVGGTPLRDMSLYQLESVYDMYKMVLTSIRNANKAFKAAKNEEISVIANRVMAEIDGLGKKKLYTTKASQAISNFDWNNLKPVYAFERIGSNSFTEVFNNVRAGEDTWAVDITEAKDFALGQRKKFKYDSWDFKKWYSFTSSSGMNFELSLDQIMSLYAYSKREQARDHLKKGGIVFDETTEVTIKNKLGIPVKFNPTQATAYNLSDDTLADIIGKLTTEQKEFVDSMQDYLSTTMGDKGNEVSLALYGVKLYKEKNYFPLKSATQFMAKAKEQQKGEVKVKNSGFSKETTPKASNPIVLTPFMDVWANHVNEMSMYHAFVLPLEDFYRVYNYKTPTSDTMATESVEMFLQNAFGKGATKYIDQLLKDLNGGARVDSTVGIINKLTGLFKKSAVFASLSVVVQQPSAIARATALVDTKYFVGKPSVTKHKETWAEVKKYAPVATIKEMGYFDTGMGQSTVDWIKDKNTWKDKVDDVASKAPALADELAWCAIWKAVKRESLHTHKDLKPNSEEFLKAVGERFTEVITKTQVYDSVLARSANMRSKDTGMKMATAFMGEPTTSLNMLENAITQGKRGNKRYARKAIGAVVSSMILNSILVSIVYAGRDDDEDKTYAEKYVGTLTEELIDSINPLTLIPFVKDIVSIVQGYDVERSDMAVITDLVNALNNLENDNRSAYRKVEDFAGAIASLFGLPVKNIMRDVRGIYNTVDSFINGEQTTKAGIKNAIEEAVTGDEKSNGQQLYEAILSGDTAQIERVKSRFEDQKAIDSAIRKALRDNDPRIKEAAEARYNGDIAEYMRIAKEIIAEGNFSQDNIVAAINSEISALKKQEGTSNSSTSSNKVTSIYEVGDYYAALEGRDQATAYAVKEDIIKTDVANGKDREEAEKNFNSRFASHLRELYEAGEITSYNAENMLVNYGGKSYEDASSKVQYWEFKKNYPDYDLSEEAVKKYYDEVEPSGIGVDVYYDYSKQRAKCNGVDANGDGKTDSGSVKREVMQVINSLPITYQQKDVLYYLNGWSASTIWEAPWH